MGRTDADLISAVQRGERDAIDELLARYETSIYRFGLRMCGNEEDAREVLQETLVAAFRHLPTFRGDAALSTWLYQIARSFCIKERRGRRPTESLDDMKGERMNLAEPAAPPDARAHAREIGAALASAIGALPPEAREAIVLRDVEGLSAEEAAAIVGIEVGALKSRLHRARLQLRQELAALLGEGAPDSDGDGDGGADRAGPAPCPELAQELSAYVSADIDQATCAHIERHLAACPSCKGACESLKRTVSLCRRIPGDEVPAPVRLAVRRAIVALTTPSTTG
jgi:RNA polymerase sigma-70 factor (ECF subfamily)